MRNVAGITPSLCLILLLLSPLPAAAVPAITCHCFTDRSFDPVRPAAADPYLLATTQNSFFAVVFAVDKKAIVIKKQQGTSADDLWIAYWVASRSDASPETLLQAKLGAKSWQEALAPLNRVTNTAGTRFPVALKAGAPPSRLAEAVVDDLLVSSRVLGDGEVAALRQAGASNQELIIAAVIAAKTGKPALPILLEVKKGTTTWGSLLRAARIDTAELPREIAGMVKQPPQ